MNEYLQRITTQISNFMGELSAGKKAALVAILGTVVAGMIFIFIWASHKTYEPLWTNLSPEDAGNIISILRDKNVPFQVSDAGKTIEIPAERVNELRLQLASTGLPETSVVGYEVFDSQALGTTSFVQKMNQKRALEGELMRTIRNIKGVKKARVHLAIPQKSTFIEDQNKSTAAVALELTPGVRLDDKQVYGIGVLVSSAVEGLDIEDVVVVDSFGKLLSKTQRDPLVAITANQLDYQRTLEDSFEKRIEEMLGRVVGEGRVVVRVNADLDFAQIQETQTIVDGDASAVVSSEKRTESLEGSRPGPMGQPGAISNAPGQMDAASQNQTKTNTNKENVVQNFEVPKTVRQTRKPSGEVKKISVAVLVDSNRKDIEENGKIVSKIEPWPPEKMKEFEEIVSSAVGINKKRGDSLEIKTMEFKEADFDKAEKLVKDAEFRRYVQNLILYFVIGAVIALFFFFVVRPFIKWVTENTMESVDTFLPQTLEELEKIQNKADVAAIEDSIPDMPETIDPEKIEGQMIKEKIVTLIDSHPQKASLILRDWIRGAKSQGNDKDAAG